MRKIKILEVILLFFLLTGTSFGSTQFEPGDFQLEINGVLLDIEAISTIDNIDFQGDTFVVSMSSSQNFKVSSAESRQFNISPTTYTTRTCPAAKSVLEIITPSSISPINYTISLGASGSCSSSDGGGGGGGGGGGEAPGPAPAPAPTPAPTPTPTPEPTPAPEPTPTPTPTPTLEPTQEQITQAETIVTETITATEVTASTETVSAVTEAVSIIAALGVDVTSINTETISSVVTAVETASELGTDVTTIDPVALATTIQAIDAAVNAGLDIATIDAQALSSVIEAVDAAATTGIDVTAINTQTLSSVIQAVNSASSGGVNVSGIDTQAMTSVIQAVDTAFNSGVNVGAIDAQALSSVIQAVNKSIDQGIDVTTISNDAIIAAVQAIDAAVIAGVDPATISPQIFSFIVQGFSTAEIAGINLSATGNAALGTIIEALNSAAGTGVAITDISFISFAGIVKQISDAKTAGADIDALRFIALNAVTKAAEARVSNAEAYEAARQISSRALKVTRAIRVGALEAIRGFTTGTAGIATIIDNTLNSGRHIWNTRGSLTIEGKEIEGLITEGSDYKIIIFSSLDPSIQDSSDNSFSFISPPTALLEPEASEDFTNLFSPRLFSFFSRGLIAQAQKNSAPSLKIIYPNGGEKFTIGKKYSIKWESKNLPPNSTINIRLAKGLKLNETAKAINKEFQKSVGLLRENPAATKTVDDIAAPTSVTVTAASAGALAVTASAGSATFAVNISELLQIIGLARFYLLGFVRFKRRKPWGRIADKLSGKPVAAALVQIYESEFKKLKDNQITDDEGRFGALVGPGKYYVKVSKKGFQTYQSEIIEITSSEQILNLEISLSPIIEEWNVEILKKISILNALKRFIELINPYLLAFGTIISAISVIILPNGLNYATFFIYIILDSLKIYFAVHLLKPFGKVVDETTNETLALTVVRIFEEDKNWLLATKVTDENGRFNFLLAPGRYYLTFSKAGYQPFNSGTIIIEKGVLPPLDIKLKKAQ